jgi:hypothetical protein
VRGRAAVFVGDVFLGTKFKKMKNEKNEKKMRKLEKKSLKRKFAGRVAALSETLRARVFRLVWA